MAQKECRKLELSDEHFAVLMRAISEYEERLSKDCETSRKNLEEAVFDHSSILHSDLGLCMSIYEAELRELAMARYLAVRLLAFQNEEEAAE